MLGAEFAQSHAKPTPYPMNFADSHLFLEKKFWESLFLVQGRIHFLVSFSVSLSFLSKVRRLRLRIQKGSSIQEAKFDITSVHDGVSEIGLSSGRVSIDLLGKQEEHGGTIR